jgi:DNA processing protein
LISSISLGVVVVEASPRSGSLITARIALDQGREVMAVPGSPLDPRARGTNQLLREGAILTENADDVLAALGPFGGNRLREPKPLISVDFRATAADGSELDHVRLTITQSLGPVPVTVDEIIRTCQCSPPLISTVLLELELAGRLERHPGNRVALLAGP